MRAIMRGHMLALMALVALGTWGCGKKDGGEKAGEAAGEATAEKGAEKAAEGPALKAGPGVDAAARLIRIGALNDESGPGAAIGKPFAAGKKILAAQINAGGTGLLPEGWKVELIEKDHGYNPSKAQQHYSAIKDDVLFVATSFGTPNTLPLRPFLEKDKVVAYPASLSSQMAEFEFTPPIGAPYSYEAMRAVDWAVESAGGADKVKFGIVYQQDDYGKDGLEGLKKAAAKHGVEIVAERPIKPGQKDFTADVGALSGAGATHVLLTVLPSSTGPLLGTAAAMKFGPVWIGNTPAWIDAFFAHPKLPAPVFANYHWAGGLPYWGENVPGMDKFMAAYKAHGKDLGRPDFYIVLSYVQGLVAVEAARLAIEAGDITREGYMKAMRGIDGFDAGGMIQKVNLKNMPYVTGEKVRILKPDFEKKSWATVSDYAAPSAIAEAAPADAPAAPAGDQK